jgi:hypothetical protein
MSDKTAQEALEEKLNPSGTETGMYNLASGVGIHCRDDGCLELFAGDSCILIDGKNGVITVLGQRINNVADTVNIKTTPSGLNINTGILSPAWLPSRVEAGGYIDRASALQRSPLVATSVANLNTQIVTGLADAQKGQMNMRLGDLVKPKPMFRAPKRAAWDIANTIKQIADNFEG